MQQIQFIFFDCMETIIDLYELPSKNDYAYWTYVNSGVEHYWNGFSDFLERYNTAKNIISETLEPHQEYEMKERLKVIVNGTDIHLQEKQAVVDRLYRNYWATYQSKCFVKEEVREAIQKLKGKYKLAVVSNFMVQNGIEELLMKHGIIHDFEFVVTSINVGWKKPDLRIYKYALSNSSCRPKEVLFIGDDFENDYLAPRRLGMNSLWLNKSTIHKGGIDQVHDFNDVVHMLLK